MQSAIVAANKEAILRLKPQDQNIVGTTCKNTGDARAPLNVEPPKVRPQGVTSCDPTAADDGCIACAKVFCCEQYLACSQDANCSCLVGCLHQGNSVTTCTSPEHCGAPSFTSIATADCLNLACGDCSGAAGLGDSLCPEAPDPWCTGSSLGGETCSMDSECISCYCNPVTGTCD
ncbi:hypothetical protein WMF31_12205 [Sorangium sp. So ce1036]|uniref:hypothetical protein n=1 Tax=Sorangium sp. So ce1036 TaxID=3133328 RepID=UPI003F0B8E07